MQLPVEAFEAQTEATKYLADHLGSGSLALVLGAGVGIPLGFPSWDGLVRRCFELQALEPPGQNLELEASRLEEHCKRNKIELRDVVHAGLYSGGRPSSRELTSSLRLSAIGALLMGSRRGSVQTVITFNYDSLLEEYLAIHGYHSRVVSSLPALHGGEDVTIFHPHGYLPAEPSLGTRSSSLVLTKESFNLLLGDPASPWVAFIRHVVRTKVLLFVGISESTLVGGPLGPILQSEAASIASRGPTAILLTADDEDPAYLPVVRNQNVAIVRLAQFDSIDDFLLGICQRAAASGLVSGH